MKDECRNCFPLKGKYALVTGSSQGIGRSIALKLAANGASVAVTYCKNKAKGEQVVESIRNSGAKAIPVKMNFMNSEEIKSGIDKIYHDFNSIDILVNNAGISGFMGPLADGCIQINGVNHATLLSICNSSGC